MTLLLVDAAGDVDEARGGDGLQGGEPRGREGRGLGRKVGTNAVGRGGGCEVAGREDEDGEAAVLEEGADEVAGLEEGDGEEEDREGAGMGRCDLHDDILVSG